MAFPCSLACLRDQDEAVRPQQRSLLQAGLLGEELDVVIRGYDEEQHLYTVTLISADDDDVKEPEQERPLKGVESVSKAERVSPRGGYLYYETIMGGVLDKTLEAEEVKEESVFVGYVEHVQNPNHFWIRTQKRNEEFEEMMTKVEDHFSQVKLEEEVLVDPELGAQCCAVYEKDMHFYRGVVTDTLDHGAEVLFMDFGNIEKVPHKCIKKIPETFARKSAFAFCCTLVNVFPLDEVWTGTLSDAFRQAVSNKALLVHVVRRRKNKLVVDLFETGQDNRRRISDLLISSGEICCWKVNTESKVHNNTKATQNSKGPRPRVTSDIGRKTKQSELSREEEIGCKNKIKKSVNPVSFKPLCIKPGFEFAVQCSNVESSSDFWCQLKDKGPALEELMDKLQKHYSSSSAPVESGVKCCVAKSLDGKWYRGFITDKHNDHASVMLIDFGLTIWVQEHHLQAILPEYVDLEGQAFRCTFSNLIEPTDPESGGNWGLEVCHSVRKFVQDGAGSLRCNFVSHAIVQNKGFCNVVDLYNTRTQQNLTSWLVKQGLATETTIPTKPLSTVSPETFVYSSYDLSPGKEEQVYVTHVSNQWEVYCHLQRNTQIIEELEKKISEESEKIMQTGTRAVVRKLCLAKYFDGKRYRVLAHPVPSPLHLGVFFVDYGNKSICEKTQVTSIPRDCADLLYTPMQALRCRLASVSEAELYPDVKDWLDRTILNKQVRAVVVGRREDGSFDVELFDGDVNINEKVKELVLSLSPKEKTVVSFAPRKVKATCRQNARIPVKSTSQLRGKWSSHRGAQVGNVAHKKKVQNYNTKIKQPNDNKTKNCDQDTNSEKPPNTKKREIPQVPCLPEKKIKVGLRAKCFVSHIDSIGSFFLHLADDEPAIEKMCEDLNSCTFRSSLRSVVSVRAEQLVLAVYEEDGALYRSLVKRPEGSSGFSVEFVDYGNSAVVEKERIHLIPAEHLSQPRLSISCCLVDASAFEDDASFTDAVTEKPVMVDFVHQDGTQWKVELQILDGEVDLPAAVGAVVETVPENKEEDEEEEEESPVTSTKMEQEMRSDQKHLREETSVNETTASERVVQSVAKCQNVSLPNKLKVKTYGRLRSRFTEKRGMKRKTSSDKTTSDRTDASIPPRIQAKDREKGTVLSVLGDGDFYVRLAHTSFLLDALDRFTADHLGKCVPVEEEDVTRGLRCLVQVPADSTWQRAVVQHVGEEECNVLLVDHGITAEIPNASVRRQCGGLTSVPGLAVLCRINCFGFGEQEDADRSWSETLKPLIGEDVSVVFVRFSEAENLWLVEVVVNGLFIVNRHDHRIQSEAGTRDDASGSRPQRLVFAPIDLDSGYFGFAAAGTSPWEFSVVLQDSLLVMDRVCVMLEELAEPTSPVPDAHVVQGTCCLLKSDSRWCRTEIVNAAGAVLLNLVDYGRVESLPLDHRSELRRLPEELVKLPKVAHPCALRGVKPAADSHWTEEAELFFLQCLNQKNLQIFFRELVPHAHWKVDVLADGAHVAREMVEAGHAHYEDALLGLRFQELVPSFVPLSSDSGQEVDASEGPSDPSAEVTEEDEGRKLPTRCDVM